MDIRALVLLAPSNHFQMFNQHRIYRVFQLITYLKTAPAKSTRSLAQLLEVSERSVYRYFDLLEQLGFSVTRKPGGFFAIETASPEGIPFRAEEIDLLHKLLQQAGAQTPMAQALAQKIASHTEPASAVRHFAKANLGRIIEELGRAMQERRQVELLKYYSASSGQVSDRLVEPMCFSDNYQMLSAYELSSGRNKYFKLERISAVRVLDSCMAHEAAHQYYAPDVFGFQGLALDKRVVLRLSLRAGLLLQEEYPMARAFLSEEPEAAGFYFSAPVQTYLAPARFVQGFRAEITVLGDPGFLDFLADQALREEESRGEGSLAE